MIYRLYLFSSGNEIAAAEHFSASDDAEADGLADTLYEVAGNRFTGYEVWREATLVVTARPKARRGARFDPATWKRAQQLHLLELEDRLAKSFACIRSSQALMDAVDKLTGVISQAKPSGRQ